MAELILKKPLGYVLGRDASAVEIQKHLARYTLLNALVSAQGNIDLASGGLLEIDSVQLEVGNCVFLMRQTEKSENGLYSAQNGPWLRQFGYNVENGQAFDHKFIHIQSGADTGKVFALATEEYVIGETPLEFFETAFSVEALPGKIPIRDETGYLGIAKATESRLGTLLSS